MSLRNKLPVLSEVLAWNTACTCLWFRREHTACTYRNTVGKRERGRRSIIIASSLALWDFETLDTLWCCCQSRCRSWEWVCFCVSLCVLLCVCCLLQLVKEAGREYFFSLEHFCFFLFFVFFGGWCFWCAVHASFNDNNNQHECSSLHVQSLL